MDFAKVEGGAGFSKDLCARNNHSLFNPLPDFKLAPIVKNQRERDATLYLASNAENSSSRVGD